jgi:DNA-binding transcriptional regulator YiaG
LKKAKKINDKEIIDFVLECKLILNSLNEDKIDEIRKKIKDLIK